MNDTITTPSVPNALHPALGPERLRAFVATMSERDSLPGVQDLNAMIRAVAERGDRQAFAALFRYFGPRLKSHLLRQGFGDGACEDIVQDAMLSVWRKAASFDPAKANASTWVFTIARNLGIDRLRREARLISVAEPQTPEEPDPTPGAEADLSFRQDEARLRVALAKLPVEQARVIEMSFYNDNPQSAIAETLGVPLGTVKSRVRLALQRLRQLMDDPS